MVANLLHILKRLWIYGLCLVTTLSCLINVCYAGSQSDALKARDEAIQALEHFNPSSALKDYTNNPRESALEPQEDNDALKLQGKNALEQNATANEVYQEAQNRPKVHPNPNSPEMQYAETLLENPDAVLDGACYKEKAHCDVSSVTKTCEEEVEYAFDSCEEKLDVQIKTITHQLNRTIRRPKHRPIVTLDLTHELPLSKTCLSLNATVTAGPYGVAVITQPSCQSPILSVMTPRHHHHFPFSITILEVMTEESWDKSNCDAMKSTRVSCLMKEGKACLFPNETKTIQGFPITRPCWGKRFDFACMTPHETACSPFLNQHCSQTASRCMETEDNRCLRYEQTFECQEELCLPEKTVCPGEYACADGQCDTSVEEQSDDMNEGLSRLGALGGVSEDAATHEVRSGAASIFKGEVAQCKQYILNARDCCTDEGWGDWIIHCPKELKDLQVARREHRVVVLGHYSDGLIDDIYSYCVFPSKLSAIFQIEGRGNQLGISYGSAKHPNCRGLTPEELERIDVSQLNLTPIENDMIKRMAPPKDLGQNIPSQVERLNQEGRAHA